MSDYIYKEIVYADPKPSSNFNFFDTYVKKCFTHEDEPFEDEVVPEYFMIMFLTRLFVDETNSNLDTNEIDYELSCYPNIFKTREIVKKYNIISEKMFNQAIDIMIYYNVATRAFNVYLCDAILNAIRCVIPEEEDEE